MLAGSGALAYAPAPLDTWVVSGGSLGSGTVQSIAVAGSTAYVGGNFSYIGPATGGAASLDATSGAISPAWPKIAGSVHAIIPDAGTGWYVGGAFLSIGTAHFGNLVHIQSNGQVDANWQATTNGPVFSLLLANGVVYAGGSFTQAGGVSHVGLAAFHATTGAVQNVTPNIAGAGGFVWTMTTRPFSSDVYVGGSFNTVGGLTRKNVASFSSTGTVSATWNPDVNSTVYALGADGTGGTIYAGGLFSQVNSTANPTARFGLAAFNNSTGAVDTNWSPNPNGPVFSMAVTGSAALTKIYVGGTFSTIGAAPSQSRASLARIDDDGLAEAWNPTVTNPSSVLHLALAGSTLYAGGFFQPVGSGPNATTRDNVVGFDTTTAVATSFAPVVGGTVYALAVNGTKVAVGGTFNSIGGVRRNNLGAIDLTTGQADTNWKPYAGNTVGALAVSGTTVYAGGLFEQVADDQSSPIRLRNHLAAFDATTGDVLAWDPSLDDGTVNALAVSGSTVYAGGTFTSVFDFTLGESVTRNRLAAFDANGDGFVTSWNPNVDDKVNALAVSGSTVYAGGNFTTVNSVTTRNRLAAFDATATAIDWDPDVNGEVNAVALSPSGSTLYAGGSFTQVNGSTGRSGAAAFGTGTGGGGEFRTTDGPGTATDWDPNLERLDTGVHVPGTVLAIATSGTNVYLGGDFDFIGNCGGTCLQGAAGAVTASTGNALSAWLPEPNASVNAIALAFDQASVLLGGPFTAVGYPRPDASYQATEPGADARGGFAAFRGLPEPPTAVTASPRDGGATLTFTPPSFSSVLVPVTYTVTSNPGNLTATGTSSPIQIDGLTNGLDYTFTITATNFLAVSQPSAISNTITPSAEPVAPSEPLGVTATPGNGEATVTFSAPASNGGAAITDYEVTSTPGNITAHGSASPIVVPGLTPDTSYTFTVKATNSAGTGPASAPSNAVFPRVPPGAPTGATAIPGNEQATINFTPPADDGGTAITGYRVIATPGGHQMDGVQSPITVTGLANGTSYTFVVLAINASGQSAPSSASNAVTPRTVPGPPTGAAAAPGNGQATVTFTAPASNGGAAITGYTVTSFPGSFTASGASSPITVVGLTNGVSYTFTVKATNAAGNGPSSLPSNDVTPGTAPVAPGAPTGVTAAPGNAQASVSFTPPADDGGSAITGYTVTSSPGGLTAAGAGSPIVVTGLTNGIAYTFTVRATNSAGTGAASAPSNSVTPNIAFTAPGAPTGVTATAGNGQAVVTFTAPLSDGNTPITHYTVTASSGGPTAVGSSSPIVVTGLTNNTSYTFTVTATNGAGTGPASSPSTAIVPHAGDRTAPPNPPPTAPRPDVPAVPPQSNPRKPPPHH